MDIGRDIDRLEFVIETIEISHLRIAGNIQRLQQILLTMHDL